MCAESIYVSRFCPGRKREHRSRFCAEEVKLTADVVKVASLTSRKIFATLHRRCAKLLAKLELCDGRDLE